MSASTGSQVLENFQRYLQLLKIQDCAFSIKDMPQRCEDHEAASYQFISSALRWAKSGGSLSFEVERAL